MNATQIYELVNSVTNQAIGRTDLVVTDASSLVALGNTVLSSQSNTDNFLNTLVMRIGKSIVSFRKYNNTFKSLMVDDFTWGAIVQKIKVKMPSAVSDPSYDLTDDASVDHYKISKPKATQRLFITNTPYMFFITIQRKQLQDAFLNDGAMASFISAVYGEVENAIEVALEELGRTTLNNMIAERNGTKCEINLLTKYNTLKGTTLTSEQAMYDESFLRYAVAVIKNVSNKMKSMSELYNDGTETRHTPLELQKLFVLSDFETSLETQVEYGAFHEKYVSLDGFEEVAYWQAIQTPTDIQVKRASDSAEKTVKGVVAVLFDRDACGMFKQDEYTLTTPVNAFGGYYNTAWHEKQLWFNDLSENFVVFTISDETSGE